MSITELYATEEKLDAAYREIARLKAELEQERARCAELAEALQFGIDNCGCTSSCGCRTHEGGGVCPGARECYKCQKARKALANPDTQKALALRQARERVIETAWFYVSEGMPLSELKVALDALREVEEG